MAIHTYSRRAIQAPARRWHSADSRDGKGDRIVSAGCDRGCSSAEGQSRSSRLRRYSATTTAPAAAGRPDDRVRETTSVAYRQSYRSAPADAIPAINHLAAAGSLRRSSRALCTDSREHPDTPDDLRSDGASWRPHAACQLRDALIATQAARGVGRWRGGAVVPAVMGGLCRALPGGLHSRARWSIAAMPPRGRAGRTSGRAQVPAPGTGVAAIAAIAAIAAAAVAAAAAAAPEWQPPAEGGSRS